MNAAVEKLSSFEWLGRELRAKVAVYEACIAATGERPPSWDEKLGVIAKMECELQKDLAYLLATGEYSAESPERKRIEDHLFKSIYAVADSEKKYKKNELPNTCRLIARMELFFFLYHWLNDDYKLQGRLRAAGILNVMTVKTYENNWKHYGDALNLMLTEAKEAADTHINNYRKDLRLKN